MSELKSDSPPRHSVKVSMGYTVNAGNFESLRIDVGLEIEGKPGENPEQTYNRASKWVEEKVSDSVQQAKADLKEG